MQVARLQRYELVSLVATGGMGEVFRARAAGEHGFQKWVAVKRILPHRAQDLDFVVRFVAEAKLAVSLSHRNIVQVFDLGRSGDDLFLVMEYVEGADFRALLTLLERAGRELPAGIAAYIASEVLQGLAYAHERTDASGDASGIVHCDISPSNLLLSYAGEVKIADFEIGRAHV